MTIQNDNPELHLAGSEKQQPEWPKCFRWYCSIAPIHGFQFIMFESTLEPATVYDSCGLKMENDWPTWTYDKVSRSAFFEPCPIPSCIVEKNPDLFPQKTNEENEIWYKYRYRPEHGDVVYTIPTSQPKPEERFYRWISPKDETMWLWLGFIGIEATSYLKDGTALEKPHRFWNEDNCKKYNLNFILEPTIPEPIRLQREKAKIPMWYARKSILNGNAYVRVDFFNTSKRVFSVTGFTADMKPQSVGTITQKDMDTHFTPPFPLASILNI